MIFAVFYLPVDPWIRAFLGLGTMYLTTSAFTLAKCVRDAQENQAVYARLDQARVEQILSEHDPFKAVSLTVRTPPRRAAPKDADPLTRRRPSALTAGNRTPVTKGAPVEHRTSLATFRTIALRVGTTAGRTAITVARGSGRPDRRATCHAEQYAARRRTASRRGRPRPGPRRSPRRRPRRAAASPTDVARAVAPQRRRAGAHQRRPRSVGRRRAGAGPGAKLPARAGHGIVGV